MEEVSQNHAKLPERVHGRGVFVPTTKQAVFSIVVIGIVVFVSCLFNPFVYDDIPQIVTNPHTQKITSIPTLLTGGMVKAGFSGVNITHTFFRPLPFTIYTIINSVFGHRPFFFHLPQVAVHILNAVLVFLILSRFTRRPLAFFLALVFLVHPLNSENAIFISNLQDALYLAFGLSALYVLVKAEGIGLSWKKSWLVALLLFLSVLSKETGILFFLVTPLYAFLFSKKSLKPLAVGIASAFASFVALHLFVSAHQLFTVTTSRIQQASLLTRLTSIPKIIFYYVDKAFVPVNLAIGQEWLVERIDVQNFFRPLIIDLLVLAVIVMGAVAVFKRRREAFNRYLFFLIWLLVGMGMHLQLFPLDATVADRWFYFPMVGLLGIVGVTASAFLPHAADGKLGRKLLVSAGILLIVVLSVLTNVRISQWRTPEKLYAHDLRYSQVSPSIDNSYGAELIKGGRIEEAKFYFERSIAANERLGFNLQHLGLIYEMEKDLPRAKELYWRDINLANGLSKDYSYSRLAGIALYDEKDYQEAIRLAEIGLKSYSPNQDSLKILAIAEHKAGNKDRARNVAKGLFELFPSQENKELYMYISNN